MAVVICYADLREYRTFLALNDLVYKRKVTIATYGDFKTYYLGFIQFHMWRLCVENPEPKAQRFNSTLFNTLSKHKEKLRFEFNIGKDERAVVLTSVIYDETVERMGIIIKRSLMKTFHDNGLTLKLDEDHSKVLKKSFFYVY